ncbi:Crp/Fnr family transcriptional regulator [Paraflavisolibacter sp. H34]|uniref:Crp/Fnr family transcriptional regulator n=1 Tax=Huijunlia imazamoxiresistens TaxID=3127457 RepID=UPI003015D963
MKKCKSSCDLQSCFLCRTSIKDWLPAVDAHRQNFQYTKGELLFKEGDPVNGVYFVYSGTVKVHKQWGSDKELIVRFAKKGDIVGHRGLGTELVFPVSATALETTTVCFFDLEFFQSSLQVNQAFLYQLLLFFADELKESERKMRNLAHMPVKGRVSLALLRLQEKFGTDASGALGISLSRQDLASYVGTTYETVFRIINDLVQEDAIGLSGKNVIIKSREKLLSYTSS